LVFIEQAKMIGYSNAWRNDAGLQMAECRAVNNYKDVSGLPLLATEIIAKVQG
jgi:hypothetical protein